MAEIPEWAAKKAAELANASPVAIGISEWNASDVKVYGIAEAFARYIAEHETAPVDPDVLAVREILFSWHSPSPGATEILNGKRDNDRAFQAALAKYRDYASDRNG